MLNKIFCITLFIMSFYGASNAATSNPENAKEMFISSGDAKLFCRVAGTGKPLIVIHGGPGLSQDYLLPQLYELAKNNRVIFYDQRGCGQSTGDINAETITLESFVSDIEAIRQTLNVDKISILGHSWGGFLAMQYAIAHQEHVDKLILSNSMPATSEGLALFMQEWVKRMAPYQEELEKIRHSEGFRDGDPDTMEQYYRLMFRQYCYMPEKVNLLSLRMTTTASLNGAKVSNILRENLLNKPFNLNNGLNLLKVSTLVLHGDVDPIPLITAQNLHENIHDSKFVIIKNCGHFPYVEEPALYFESIHNFLHINNSSNKG